MPLELLEPLPLVQVLYPLVKVLHALLEVSVTLVLQRHRHALLAMSESHRLEEGRLLKASLLDAAALQAEESLEVVGLTEVLEVVASTRAEDQQQLPPGRY